MCDWKACWDVELLDDTLFCYGAVSLFSLSEPRSTGLSLSIITTTSKKEIKVNFNLQLYVEAKKMYRDLLAKWKARESTDENPTNDCLAIARDVFCAYSIPKCKNNNNV